MQQVVYQIWGRLKPRFLSWTAVDELINFWDRFVQRDHEIYEVLCAVHMIVVRMGNEYYIQIAILLSDKLLYIIQELLMIFNTRINQHPLLPSAQSEAISPT